MRRLMMSRRTRTVENAIFGKRRTRSSGRAAERDGLTGLYNRHTFYLRAHEALLANPGTSYVIVRTDLDRFKVYNDLFGSDEGDRLLRDIGKRLLRVAGTDGLCGRLQSDHFALLTREEAFDVTHEMNEIARWLKDYRPNYEFSFSMGIYRVENPSLDVGLMCDRALLALTTLKQGYGCKYAYYDDALRQRIMFEQEIVGDMLNALSNNQFELYFQPQYSYSTGAIRAAEALVRWNHPRRGLISPAMFIPLFEKNGFITRLDEYVWTRACQTLKQWRSDERLARIPVSVNISRLDIYNPGLPELFKRLTEEHGIDAGSLNLEITESAYVENPVQLIEVVERLKGFGFQIEMDDFGSGYSSLNTLKDVPADVLKLDLNFLVGKNNERGGNILSSVVRMARWLGMPVIAEGVETCQQADFLLSIGCDVMQGYLFARPMPESQLRALLLDGKGTAPLLAAATTSFPNANAFWNPDSQATLIFNSYVGGAAILEYADDQIEVLRINDSYLRTIHMTREAYEPYRRNLLDSLFCEDREPCIRMLQEAIASGAEAECELHFKPREGTDDVGTWLRARVRLLSQSQGNYTFYALVEETTEKQALAEQLNSLMKSMPGGIAMYEIGQTIKTVYFNDTLAQMSGMSREEYGHVVREDALAIVYPEDQSVLREKVGLYFSEGLEHMRATFRVLHKDGSLRWVRMSGSTMRTTKNVYYTSAIYLDVTAEHEAEERLRRREEVIARLCDTVPCGIVQYSADGNNLVSYINKTAINILGFESEAHFFEYTEGVIFRCVSPDDLELTQGYIARLQQGIGSINFLHRIVRPDGQICRVRGTGELAQNLDGSPVIQSVFYDDSAEHTLRMERLLGQYAQVLFTAFDEVFEIDYANRTCKMLFSRNYAQPSGTHRDLDAAIGDWLNIAVHPEDRAKVDDLLRHPAQASEGGVQDVTYRLIFPDKELLYSASILPTGKNTVLLCNRDVTERVQSERALKENAALLAARKEQDRYRIIVEQTGSAIVDWDRESQSFYISPSYKKYTLSREMRFDRILSHARLTACVHPDDARHISHFFKELKEGASRIEVIVRLSMEEGGYRWSKVSSYFIRDEGGRIVRAVGTITDFENAMRTRAEKEALSDQFDHIMANLPVGVAIYEIQKGRVEPIYTSALVLSMMGVERSEYEREVREGDTMASLNLGTSNPAFMEKALRDGGFALEYEFLRLDGEKVWVRIQGSFQTRAQRMLCYVVFTNITSSIADDAQRKWKDQRYRIISDLTHTMTFDYEPARDMLTYYLDQAGTGAEEHVIDRFRAALLGGKCESIEPGSVHELLSVFNAAMEGEESGTVEYQASLRDRGMRWYRSCWMSVRDDSGAVCHIVGRIDDIQAERVLRRKAEYDLLTGVSNRATTEERLTAALEDKMLCGKCVIALLDIDNFKEINDTYGHVTGDELLRAIGKLLRSSFREQDVVGRIGGDEFAVMLVRVTPELAMKKMRSVKDRIRNLAHALNISGSLSLSAGLYLIDEQTLTLTQAYARADAALYTAKRGGKNCCVLYDPSMGEEDFFCVR